jgi:glycerol-3-phosphate acyltransferase PlsY
LVTLNIIFLLAAAYLLGSIPTAVWWGKGFYKIDVREFGSGNAGATNTFRVLGAKAGIPVLLVDILKGMAAVLLARLSGYEFGSAQYINFELCLGVAALLGHIFPLMAGFRGGKGVATLLGVVICLHPLACACSLGVFLAVLIASRYVSLSSMMAGLTFPFFLNLVFYNTNPVLVAFSCLVAVLLIITHKKNITRLLKHQESKVKLFSKKA